MIRIGISSFSYSDGTTILEDLDITLCPGRVSVLMGPSGCGKSTLLRILMGLERGAVGTIECDTRKTSVELARWNSTQDLFGIVPQVPHLFPWKTVYQNIAIAIPPAVTVEARAKLVEHVLEIVQLKEHAQKYPGALSQGMAQRAAFARAFVMPIEALLLDEPFAALDAHTRALLQKWFAERVVVQGIPSLFVTHDVREAILLGSEIHVLSSYPARQIKSFVLDCDRTKPDWKTSLDIVKLEDEITALLG